LRLKISFTRVAKTAAVVAHYTKIQTIQHKTVTDNKKKKDNKKRKII